MQANNLMNKTDTHPKENRQKSSLKRRVSLSRSSLFLLLTINLILLITISWIIFGKQIQLPIVFTSQMAKLSSITPTYTPTLNLPTLTLSPTSTVEITETPSVNAQATAIDWKYGVVFLSIREGAYAHIFAYQPNAGGEDLFLPLTRLTNGEWNDITPVVSPDGKSIIFASNRDGFWGLYRLDLSTGEVSGLVKSNTYNASPSISPDGNWVVYESYLEENLEILISSINGEEEPIRLTHHAAADYEPSWSPQGRKIAFVSTRNGKSEVWVADLDRPDNDRFTMISQPENAFASHPVWSPDGHYLAWAGIDEYGYHQIYVWDQDNHQTKPRAIGSGDYPIWSPDGKTIIAVLQTPQSYKITAYRFDIPGLILLPLLPLPGSVQGITWGEVSFSPNLFETRLITPTPLWLPRILSGVSLPGGRQQIVSLIDVEAPHPQLLDEVDEAFIALRKQLIEESGWDLLSTLENAYIPLTVSLEPGMREDWLYTGRAFRFTPLPINAGWMVVGREDFGSETYWRVYIRTRYQDGSQGQPLHMIPWNFDARYQINPKAYEGGGMYSQFVPKGYWIDLTDLANQYNWERLPALSTWRSSYSSARFNEFVLRAGLDWETAILEIYPPEVLLTPTPIPTPTVTVTPKPRWHQSPTPTSTETSTPTVFPTKTPSLTMTPFP